MGLPTHSPSAGAAVPTQISTQNKNADGSGNHDTIFTAAASGDGHRINHITLTAPANQLKQDLIRIFYFDGSNTRLIPGGEIEVPEQTLTDSRQRWRAIWTPAGGRGLKVEINDELRAATYEGQTYNSIVDAHDITN